MWSRDTLHTELDFGQSFIGSGWDVIPRLYAGTPTGCISVLSPALGQPARQDHAAPMLKAFLNVEFASAVTLLYQADGQTLTVIGLAHNQYGCTFHGLAIDFDIQRGGAVFGTRYDPWPEHVPLPLLLILPFKNEPLDVQAFRDFQRSLERLPPRDERVAQCSTTDMRCGGCRGGESAVSIWPCYTRHTSAFISNDKHREPFR